MPEPLRPALPFDAQELIRRYNPATGSDQRSSVALSIAQMTGKSPERVLAWWNTLSPADQARVENSIKFRAGDEGGSAMWAAYSQVGRDIDAWEQEAKDRAAEEEEGKKRAKNEAAAQAFADEMLNFDVNSPENQRLMNAIQGSSRQYSAGRGIGGGVASSAAERATADAVMAVRDQRRALGAQALEGRLNYLNNERSWRQKERDANLQNEYALQDTDYQNQVAGWQARRGTGQMIGTLAGAALGGIAGSVIPGVGTAAGITAGSAMGGGIAGSMYGGGPAAPTRRRRFSPSGMSGV